MYELLDSLAIIAAGTFAWMASIGKIKVFRDEEASRTFQEKVGKYLKYIAPIVVMLGTFQLFQSSYGYP